MVSFKIGLITALIVLSGPIFAQLTKVSFTVPYKSTGVKLLVINGQTVSVPYTVSGTRTVTAWVDVPKPETNTINLKATPSPFSVYLQWDSVPGCKAYNVYRNDTLITTINGLDTWDAILSPNRAVKYKVQPDNSDAATIAVTTLPAPIRGTKMKGNRKTFTATVTDGIVSGYDLEFGAEDIGKCISIEGGRLAKWYRDAPLWWHGYIADVTEGGSAIVNSELYGKPINCNGEGYYGSNNYDAYLAEFADTTARQINFDGNYLIDPFRSETFMNHRGDFGNRDMVPHLNNRALFINGGSLFFGQEDAIGTALYSGPGHVWHELPLIAIQHGGGVLAMNCNVYGPSTEPLMNREDYPRHYFYRADVSPTPKQVFFSGNFGDTANYLNGFFFGFFMKAPTVIGGKSVIAMIDAIISNAWPFTMAVTGTNPEVGLYDKSYRFLLRNSTINGSGRNTVSMPVMGTVGLGGVVHVDSVLYPRFSFYGLSYYGDNSLLIKAPEADAGNGNAFTNVVWRNQVNVVSAYTAIIPVTPTNRSNQYLRQTPLIYGKVMLNTAKDMQPEIGIEGHVLYHNVCEIEGYNSTIKDYNTAFIRQNGADGLQGHYRQWSLVGMQYQPPPVISPWFEPMRAMGYYLQYSTSQAPPLVQFQGMGFQGYRLVR